MSISKLRGKSAILAQNDSNNNQSNSKPIKPYVPAATASLLKIEPFVPTFSSRFRKPIYKSYSTLSSSYFKRINDQKYHQRTGRFPERGFQQQQRSKSSLSSATKTSQNGISRIARAACDQEKLPDRINYDRRGLTAIPIFENEQNLRLLSLQHNLINIFHIPDDSLTQRASSASIPQQENDKPLLADPGYETEKDFIFVENAPTSSGNIGKSSTNVSGTNSINIMPMSPSPSMLSVYGGPQKPPHGKKPVLLQNHQKYPSLRKSNSFINQFPHHFNQGMKHTLHKGSPHVRNNVNASVISLANLGSDLSRQSALDPGESNIDGGSSDIQQLKVKNNQLIPSYGKVFQNLVFLDLYDNQIEKVSTLDGLKSLTVLLLGKNRISDISGLSSLRNTLRVLDLHGNKISNIFNKISCMQKLKSLNLAGNQIRQINQNDFAGMNSLKELNLKRNRIKRVYGFHHLVNLERLWLCHNDIHHVEEMYSIGDATNLQEVTIENNPVSLAGDCVSFLVSYLPNLLLLSQMPITDQVRNAALAWRKNKELAYTNQCNENEGSNGNIRREEVISNARTNWELLRSQQTVTPNKNAKIIPDSMPFEISLAEPNMCQIQESHRAPKMEEAGINSRNRKVLENLPRQKSRDISTLDSQEDFFRLPPINPCNVLNSKTPSEKTNSSGSSLGPNVDSSSSCYTSDDNDEAHFLNPEIKPEAIATDSHEQPTTDKLNTTPTLDVLPNKEIENEQVTSECSPPDNTFETHEVAGEQAEVILSNVLPQPAQAQNTPGSCLAPVASNHTDKISKPSFSLISVNSHSDTSSQITQLTDKGMKNRAGSTVNRRYIHGALIRSQTTRGKSTLPNNHFYNNSNANSTNASAVTSNCSKPVKSAAEREREQGGDYLIEICGRYLNVYGQGALRFIDKQWNTQKANDVQTLNFSYVNFNSIAGILSRIKLRFPNAESFVFRETNINTLGQLNALAELQGITSLVVDVEGNPICTKYWRPYAIYRLSHWGLKSINSVEVTEAEVEAAHIDYLGLSDLVLWSLPESLLQPLLARLQLEETCTASKLSAKEWLMRADQSLKVVVGKEALQWKKSTVPTSNNLSINNQCPEQECQLRDRGTLQLSVMIENMCNAVEKLQMLDKIWPSLLLDIIRNTLLDYSQSEVYIKNLMADILK